MERVTTLNAARTSAIAQLGTTTPTGRRVRPIAEFEACGETRTSCVVVAAPLLDTTELELSTDTDSGPVNILFETFDTEPTCPQ
jgi:hypothetical protein